MANPFLLLILISFFSFSLGDLGDYAISRWMNETLGTYASFECISLFPRTSPTVACSIRISSEEQPYIGVTRLGDNPYRLNMYELHNIRPGKWVHFIFYYIAIIAAEDETKYIELSLPAATTGRIACELKRDNIIYTGYYAVQDTSTLLLGQLDANFIAFRNKTLSFPGAYERPCGSVPEGQCDLDSKRYQDGCVTHIASYRPRHSIDSGLVSGNTSHRHRIIQRCQ